MRQLQQAMDGGQYRCASNLLFSTPNGWTRLHSRRCSWSDFMRRRAFLLQIDMEKPHRTSRWRLCDIRRDLRDKKIHLVD